MGYRREDNIKTGLKVISYKSIDLIRLTQDRGQLWAVVKVVMLWVS
jgi:hypothetical protein